MVLTVATATVVLAVTTIAVLVAVVGVAPVVIWAVVSSHRCATTTNQWCYAPLPASSRIRLVSIRCGQPLIWAEHPYPSLMSGISHPYWSPLSFVSPTSSPHPPQLQQVSCRGSIHCRGLVRNVHLFAKANVCVQHRCLLTISIDQTFYLFDLLMFFCSMQLRNDDFWSIGTSGWCWTFSSATCSLVSSSSTNSILIFRANKMF